ncbi:MAG: hypothetical protein FD121_592 [Gallionellaceae bacterium]|nr:MAG: hypothetical protein FD121_592 [Gallionellaceae bacterium]
MKYLLVLLSFTFSLANAAPFSNGSIENGKTLFVEYDCNSCHKSIVGGDGNAIFTRSTSKVRTPNDLIQQIERCSAASHLDSKEKIDLGAYLNQKYYKLK